MAVSRVALYFLLLLVEAASLLEQGYWEVQFDKNHTLQGFSKSMYQGTSVAVMINCRDDLDVGMVEVKWTLRMSPCAGEYRPAGFDEDTLRTVMECPRCVWEDTYYKTVEYISFDTTSKCGTGHIVLPDWSNHKPTKDEVIVVGDGNGANSEKPVKAKAAQTEPDITTTTTTGKPIPNDDKNTVAKAWTDAFYLFVLEIKPVYMKKDFQVDVVVQMLSPYGYLSAVDWPLLIFYGVMGLVYIAYGIAWLVMLACNWNDLQHIQVWIGAVIFLGMLEKATVFAVLESTNKTGTLVYGAIIFAALVSILKGTVVRMLLIFLSLGYGIVKPQLDKAFYTVLCVGALFLILSSINVGSMWFQKFSPMVVVIPLVLVEIVIWCWIIISLIRTYRTLKLKNTTAKLSVYRHFTVTLIVFGLATIAFIIWSIVQHRMNLCPTDWKELWVDDASQQLLLSVLLLIIMILWRPTAFNQRYAFSPLLDADNDESEDTLEDHALGFSLAGAPSTAASDIGPVSSSTGTTATAASPALRSMSDLDILGQDLLQESRL